VIRFNEASRAEWRRGWPVALGAALAGGTGGALFFYLSSLFVTGISEEFGWSRGEVAGVYAVAGVGALASPLIGWLVDRVGFKPVALAATLGLIALYIVFALYRGPIWGFIVLAALYGLFAVGTGALVYTRPINTWFDASRGLALGISTIGVSVFAIIAPPLLTWAMAAWGWRAGYLVLAALAASVAIPCLVLLVRSRPPVTHESYAAAAPLVGATLAAAARTTPFWLLAAALAAINAAGTGALSQLAPLLEDKGLSKGAAALAVSCYAVGLIVGRLGCGAMLDRAPPARVASAFTLAPALGCALVFVVPFLPWIAFPAAMLIGMQQGAETDVLAYFVSRLFGMANYSAIYGAIAFVGFLGTTLGILLFGQVHDRTGNYDAATIGAAVAFLFGAFAFLCIGRPALHVATWKSATTT
jgi:MFS family permease